MSKFTDWLYYAAEEKSFLNAHPDISLYSLKWFKEIVNRQTFIFNSFSIGISSFFHSAVKENIFIYPQWNVCDKRVKLDQMLIKFEGVFIIHEKRC